MACLGVQIGSGGGGRRVSVAGLESVTAGGQFPQGLSACLSDRQQQWRNPRMSTVGVCCSAVANATMGLTYTPGWVCNESGERDQRKEPTIAPQLDQLMKDSVAEIVKNISQAPFLVHVFSPQDGNEPNPSNLVIEKASSDSWPYIKRRWETGNSVPDGVILVEELQDRDAVSEKVEDTNPSSCCTSSTSNQMLPSSPSSTRFWGLLVQGRGVTCPSCYILKTCQVQCCVGFSTHFCLAKVDCFGKNVDYHMSKLWLQR